MACRVYRADLGSGFAQFRAPSGIKTSSNSIGFGHFAQYMCHDKHWTQGKYKTNLALFVRFFFFKSMLNCNVHHVDF